MRLCAKDSFFVLRQPHKAMMAVTRAENKTDNLKREEAVKKMYTGVKEPWICIQHYYLLTRLA